MPTTDDRSMTRFAEVIENSGRAYDARRGRDAH